jgi:glutathione S-transferase
MEPIVSDNCPFCQRCLFVLEEKAAPCTLREVDLSEKQTFKNLLSPYARVPVLWHAGRPIDESSIINEYFEETFPARPLLPKDAVERATARFWIDFCNTRFMPAYFNLLKERDPEARAPLRTRLMEHLEFIDRTGLARTSLAAPYWMGGDVTLVDYAFYPFFERLAAVEAYRQVKVPANFERLHEWLRTMRERQTVKRLGRSSEHYMEYFGRHYADARAAFL